MAAELFEVNPDLYPVLSDIPFVVPPEGNYFFKYFPLDEKRGEALVSVHRELKKVCALMRENLPKRVTYAYCLDSSLDTLYRRAWGVWGYSYFEEPVYNNEKPVKHAFKYFPPFIHSPRLEVQLSRYEKRVGERRKLHLGKQILELGTALVREDEQVIGEVRAWDGDEWSRYPIADLGTGLKDILHEISDQGDFNNFFEHKSNNQLLDHFISTRLIES